MGRDLVSKPYGRFFYLPHYLADRGHDVQILLLDYRNGKPIDERVHGVRWISVPFQIHRPWAYLAKIRQLISESQPDWLVGLSDTYFGILAQYFGKRHGIYSCIDAYDNYESYIPWLKPLHWLWRSALKKADLVTAAGPGLLGLMSAGRGNKPSVVVPMAADPVGFSPMDREECRKKMGLPVDGKLIGYCGSMHKSRGVEVLFEAFEQLRGKYPDVELVHSGRTWGNVPLPASVHSLGYVEDGDMPVLLNCMDTLVVTNKVSSFGNHSYPVKLYEAMACKIPVVATRTLATTWILDAAPMQLVKPADSVAMCKALERSLRSRSINYGDSTDWKASASALEQALLDCGN